MTVTLRAKGQEETPLRVSAVEGQIDALFQAELFDGSTVDIIDADGNIVGGGGGGGTGHVIQDEGVSLATRTTMNFVGDGVVVTDSGGKTIVTIDGAHEIQDEGTPLAQRTMMSFEGAGVVVTDDGTTTVVTIPGTQDGPPHVIEDEGTPLTQRTNMNFVGTGVTVTDAGGKTVVTIPGQAAGIDGHVIQDESTPLTQRANLDFQGAGVTVTDGGGATIVTIPAAPGGGHTIQDEGSSLTQRALMSFEGAGVTAADSGGKTVVTIPGGGGGGGTTLHPWFATTLSAPTAWGDTTISLTDVIPNFSDLRQGAFVIDPWTANCEIRRPLVVGNTNPYQLQAQRNWLPQKTQIISVAKIIRWHRTITSISASGTVLTVVVNAPLDVVVGDFVQIWGTTNFNRRYHGAIATLAGDKLSFTLPWRGTIPATETAGFVARYSHRYFTKNFRVGEKFKITGSVAGNNGTYTVATVDALGGGITTVEAIPADENQNNALAFTWDIQKVHSAGTPVLWIPNRRVPVAIYGIIGDGTDEGTKIQNMAWDLGAINGVAEFSNRSYGTAVQIIAPQMTFRGNGQAGVSILVELATSYPDTSLGLISGQTTAGVVGGGSRLVLDGFHLTGRPATVNGVGVLINTQQPNAWPMARIDNFGAEGLVLRGQQGAFYTLEILNGTVAGLTLEGAILFNFYDLDIEGQTAGAVIRNPVFSGPARQNRVFGFHAEHSSPVYLYDVDESGETGLDIYGGWWSPTGATSKGVYNHPVDTTQKGAQYRLKGFFVNTTTDFNMIEDVPAGISLLNYAYFRQHVDFERVSMPQNQLNRNATTMRMVAGPQGQLFAYGADLPFSALMQMKQPIANTGEFIRLDTSVQDGVYKVLSKGAVEMFEQADPAAPAANFARVYTRDNGAGKTQLVARFPTGAIQVLATEP